MSEIMRLVRLPAVDMMRLQSENRRLAEALEVCQAANAVLTQELDTREKERQTLIRRARLLREERDDARHERDCLRARRDEAYALAIAGSRRAVKRRRSMARQVAAEGLCLAVTALLLFCLGSKAASWIRYWMG